MVDIRFRSKQEAFEEGVRRGNAFYESCIKSHTGSDCASVALSELPNQYPDQKQLCDRSGTSFYWEGTPATKECVFLTGLIAGSRYHRKETEPAEFQLIVEEGNTSRLGVFSIPVYWEKGEKFFFVGNITLVSNDQGYLFLYDTTPYSEYPSVEEFNTLVNKTPVPKNFIPLGALIPQIKERQIKAVSTDFVQGLVTLRYEGSNGSEFFSFYARSHWKMDGKKIVRKIEFIPSATHIVVPQPSVEGLKQAFDSGFSEAKMMVDDCKNEPNQNSCIEGHISQQSKRESMNTRCTGKSAYFENWGGTAFDSSCAYVAGFQIPINNFVLTAKRDRYLREVTDTREKVSGHVPRGLFIKYFPSHFEFGAMTFLDQNVVVGIGEGRVGFTTTSQNIPHQIFFDDEIPRAQGRTLREVEFDHRTMQITLIFEPLSNGSWCRTSPPERMTVKIISEYQFDSQKGIWKKIRLALTLNEKAQ